MSMNINNDAFLIQSRLLKIITDNLCEKLPEGGIYNVSQNLRISVSKLPNIVEEFNNAEDRITKIRKAIQIQTILDECIEYLDFIALTRQFNVNHLFIEFNNLLIQFQNRRIYDLKSEEARIDLLNLN